MQKILYECTLIFFAAMIAIVVFAYITAYLEYQKDKRKNRYL